MPRTNLIKKELTLYNFIKFHDWEHGDSYDLEYDYVYHHVVS